MSDNVIEITEPVTIRGWIPGGKGGFGYSATPLHRLVRRTSRHDEAACGASFNDQYIEVRPAGRDGRPTPKQVEKYGTCKRCWPEMQS